METLKNLFERRHQLLSEAQRVALDNEGTAEERKAKLDAMLADVASFESVIEAEQRAAKLAAPSIAGIRGEVGDGLTVNVSEKRKKSFVDYIRHGVIAPELRAMNQYGQLQEVRDLTTTTGSISGGLFIEQEFDSQLHQAQKDYGQITSLVRLLNTDTGAPIKTSGIDFTGVTATLTGETVAYSDATPAVSGALSSTDSYTGEVKVTIQELADAAYSIEDLLTSGFGQVYYRTLSNAIVAGNSSNVASILTPFSGTPILPVSTSFGPGAIAFSDLVAVYSQIDAAFLNKSTWGFNSTVRGLLLGLVDNYGRPIMIINGQAGNLDTIMGRPVAVVEQLPGVAASSLGTVVLASWSDLYTLRTVRNSLNIFRDPFTFRANGYIGFYLEFRAGGYLNPMGASKHGSALKMHA